MFHELNLACADHQIGILFDFIFYQHSRVWGFFAIYHDQFKILGGHVTGLLVVGCCDKHVGLPGHVAVPVAGLAGPDGPFDIKGIKVHILGNGFDTLGSLVMDLNSLESIVGFGASEVARNIKNKALRKLALDWVCWGSAELKMAQMKAVAKLCKTRALKLG